MVLVSYSGREINAKLVYYGPGLSGKTTNLEYIYGSIPQGQRGKMVSMKTKTERTLFFDFLPVHLGELSGFKTRFLLYTVPGQVYYNATRKLVLKGVDAVVFVADSKRGKMDENVESLDNLKENLKDLGLSLDKLPWVIQYNKRDLSDTYALDELEAVLNPGHVPSFEGVASTGVGVVETFKGISRLLLRKLAKDVGVPVVGSTVEAGGAPAPAVAEDAVTPVASATPMAPVVPAAPMAPVIPAAPMAPTVSAAPAASAWNSPAAAMRDVPIEMGATDPSWTVAPDTVPWARGGEAPPIADTAGRGVRDQETPSDTGWQLPPVAEPVRISGAGSEGARDWVGRGSADESPERHVSVGERLRRWLARAPEPEETEGERYGTAPEMTEPAPDTTEPGPIMAESTQAEADSVTTDRVGSAPVEAAPITPVRFAPVPSEPVPVEPASVVPVPVEAAATTASAMSPEPILVLQPRPHSFPPVAEAVVVETPTVVLDVVAGSAGEPRAAAAATMEPPQLEPPRLEPIAPRMAPPASAIQPPLRRRRPREIMVPLDLNPEDLAEGVVLRVTIRMQQALDDPEGEAEQYAA
jgi:mutual gliding-motility protein MglA